MKIIETELAPSPGGHYSQAVVAQGLVFVAGLLPIVPNTTAIIPDGIEAQTEQVLNNLTVILNAAGSGIDKLVSVQIFIPNIRMWDQVNSVYKKFLGEHKPARTVVPCNPLHYGALIELNAVAECS